MNEAESNSRLQINITDFSFLGEIEKFEFLNNELSIIFNLQNDKESSSLKQYKLNGKSIIKNPKKYIKLVIKEITEVFMNDWFEDESLPKSNVNGQTIRLNEASGILEYNVKREIGSDLPLDYFKYLNIEDDKEVISIYNDKLNLMYTEIITSLCIEDDKGNILTFFTGPLTINSKKVTFEEMF